MAIHDPTHLFDGHISDKTRDRAMIISALTQPQFASIVLFAIVCLVCTSVTEYLVIYGISVFFGCIFPIIEVL